MTARARAEDDDVRRRRLARLAVGLVLLLLAGLVAVLAAEHRDRRRLAEVQRPGGAALAAAAQAARTLFSYDSGSLEADLRAALPLTTAPYTARYRQGAQQVVFPAARADGSSVIADVRQVGATRDTTSDRLVALVLLDRTTTRVGSDEATTAPEQVRMTLVQRAGRWRVSDVQQL